MNKLIFIWFFLVLIRCQNQKPVQVTNEPIQTKQFNAEDLATFYFPSQLHNKVCEYQDQASRQKYYISNQFQDSALILKSLYLDKENLKEKMLINTKNMTIKKGIYYQNKNGSKNKQEIYIIKPDYFNCIYEIENFNFPNPDHTGILCIEKKMLVKQTSTYYYKKAEHAAIYLKQLRFDTGYYTNLSRNQKNEQNSKNLTDSSKSFYQNRIIIESVFIKNLGLVDEKRFIADQQGKIKQQLMHIKLTKIVAAKDYFQKGIKNE